MTTALPFEGEELEHILTHIESNPQVYGRTDMKAKLTATVRTLQSTLAEIAAKCALLPSGDELQDLVLNDIPELIYTTCPDLRPKPHASYQHPPEGELPF